ncbi:MAG: iron-containing alcohol dehydrogenase [Pseudomonadota bacterium]
MSQYANWSFPTAVRFGAGRIAELPEACRSLGLSHPLLVTDPGIAKLPFLREVIDHCAADGLELAVFSDIKGNPSESNVRDGIAALIEGGHDSVIALGGGSALDVGKVIAFMAGQTRPMWDFEDVGDWWTRANPESILPIIAIPTTAGTGSEVGRAGVIGRDDTGEKKVIFHPKMMPSIVISDPELSVGLPPALTAWTGMDALAHCVEALCAPGFHPMTDGIAVEGIRLVKTYLPRAFADGTDIEARSGMLAAASMGATAFQKGLGAVHALSHPVGAVHDTHHGLTNAVILPYVMAFNRSKIDARMRQLAGYLELPDPSFDSVLDWVIKLRRELEIPHDLEELGVDGSRFDTLAEMALIDPTAAGNPVTLTKANCIELYETCHQGNLPP